MTGLFDFSALRKKARVRLDNNMVLGNLIYKPVKDVFSKRPSPRSLGSLRPFDLKDLDADEIRVMFRMTPAGAVLAKGYFQYMGSPMKVVTDEKGVEHEIRKKYSQVNTEFFFEDLIEMLKDMFANDFPERPLSDFFEGGPSISQEHDAWKRYYGMMPYGEVRDEKHHSMPARAWRQLTMPELKEVFPELKTLPDEYTTIIAAYIYEFPWREMVNYFTIEKRVMNLRARPREYITNQIEHATRIQRLRHAKNLIGWYTDERAKWIYGKLAKPHSVLTKDQFMNQLVILGLDKEIVKTRRKSKAPAREYTFPPSKDELFHMRNIEGIKELFATKGLILTGKGDIEETGKGWIVSDRSNEYAVERTTALIQNEPIPGIEFTEEEKYRAVEALVVTLTEKEYSKEITAYQYVNGLSEDVLPAALPDNLRDLWNQLQDTIQSPWPVSRYIPIGDAESLEKELIKHGYTHDEVFELVAAAPGKPHGGYLTEKFTHRLAVRDDYVWDWDPEFPQPSEEFLRKEEVITFGPPSDWERGLESGSLGSITLTPEIKSDIMKKVMDTGYEYVGAVKGGKIIFQKNVLSNLIQVPSEDVTSMKSADYYFHTHAVDMSPIPSSMDLNEIPQIMADKPVAFAGSQGIIIMKLDHKVDGDGIWTDVTNRATQIVMDTQMDRPLAEFKAFVEVAERSGINVKAISIESGLEFRDNTLASGELGVLSKKEIEKLIIEVYSGLPPGTAMSVAHTDEVLRVKGWKVPAHNLLKAYQDMVMRGIMQDVGGKYMMGVPFYPKAVSKMEWDALPEQYKKYFTASGDGQVLFSNAPVEIQAEIDKALELLRNADPSQKKMDQFEANRLGCMCAEPDTVPGEIFYRHFADEHSARLEMSELQLKGYAATVKGDKFGSWNLYIITTGGLNSGQPRVCPKGCMTRGGAPIVMKMAQTTGDEVSYYCTRCGFSERVTQSGKMPIEMQTILDNIKADIQRQITHKMKAQYGKEVFPITIYTEHAQSPIIISSLKREWEINTPGLQIIEVIGKKGALGALNIVEAVYRKIDEAATIEDVQTLYREIHQLALPKSEKEKLRKQLELKHMQMGGNALGEHAHVTGPEIPYPANIELMGKITSNLSKKMAENKQEKMLIMVNVFPMLIEKQVPKHVLDELYSLTTKKDITDIEISGELKALMRDIDGATRGGTMGNAVDTEHSVEHEIKVKRDEWHMQGYNDKMIQMAVDWARNYSNGMAKYLTGADEAVRKRVADSFMPKALKLAENWLKTMAGED